MKRGIFLTLLLLNLACASSAFNMAATAQTATPAKRIAAPTATATASALCAVVVAVKNLNLRDHADGAVIDYLNHGEVVQVIDNSGAWWKVQTDSNIGYAHSAYLQIVECVQ